MPRKRASAAYAKVNLAIIDVARRETRNRYKVDEINFGKLYGYFRFAFNFHMVCNYALKKDSRFSRFAHSWGNMIIGPPKCVISAKLYRFPSLPIPVFAIPLAAGFPQDRIFHLSKTLRYIFCFCFLFLYNVKVN